MNGNCLLISLNGHGESEGDIFILGIIPDVFKEFRNSGVSTPKVGLSSTSIANLECVVLPLGNNNEAIPLEATVKTMPPLDRTTDDKVFHIKVLPRRKASSSCRTTLQMKGNYGGSW
ncbi:hypothetical protein HKD37_07G020216 [Glycine soja]